MKQRIALLGSTGSIGQQTLDIVRAYSESFEITTLTANRNWEALAAQAREFEPDSVVLADKTHYPDLKAALADLPVKVYAGEEALCQVVKGGNVDTVVNALVGYAGLAPTVASLEAGRKLALANKESLVVAGELVMGLATRHKAPILPVDSEHSAIFQCLIGEVSPIRKILLTASGGPFRQTPKEALEKVTVKQALSHPNWEMGAKITIDSATLLNKGFEVIEARWLFGVRPEQIEVVVHPQSIIHSMVEFDDGAIKAQLGTPDMHLPIQYALTFPQRWNSTQEPFSFARCTGFTFEQPDRERFPALQLAFEALARGGNSCCTLNAANEKAVAAFLDRQIGFTEIPRIIETTLAKATFIAKPTLEDYQASDAEAREISQRLIRKS